MWVCDDPRGFRHRGGAGCERPNQGRSVCNGVQSTTAMRPASAASRSGVHVMTMPLTVQASAHAHSSTTITSGEITMCAKKLLVIAVGLALIHGQSWAQDAEAPTPAPAKADDDKAVLIDAEIGRAAVGEEWVGTCRCRCSVSFEKNKR